jgi:hypothetical protein
MLNGPPWQLSIEISGPAGVGMPSSRAVTDRGRLQVQGFDLPGAGLSRAWAQSTPKTAASAHSDLVALEGECSPEQHSLRCQAFAKAKDFVLNARGQNLAPPVSRTFRNRGLTPAQSSARVDLEAVLGRLVFT